MRLRYPLVSLLVLAAGLVAGLCTLRSADLPERGVMERSFRRMQEAEASIKAYVEGQGIALEAEDREGTYLIGPELSPLVTTMGYPDVKRTTLSPDSAALLVRLFTEAGLREGDVVGVGTSGSFPGYLVATLCAAEEMGLKVRLAASLGASMYGATRPELSILTILNLLQQDGFHFEVVAVSPGGDGDRGKGAYDGLVYDDTKQLSRSLLHASGFPVLDEEDLGSNIRKRKALFGPISCFVNIGGAEPNVGNGAEILGLAPGLVVQKRNLPLRPDRGLVFDYLAEGIPVLNLLQVRKLASRYGIPFDPSPLPSNPSGPLYQSRIGPSWIPLATLLLAVGILLWGKERR
ncbi:MAG: poly-gamma-glutamate system protein [Sphaerochaetaceae bacterium]|nr:poly-gamma-glutamate system protein [Spirochaetales bacterium]MDY5499473.1 poly-gamma-glutamate system protein [Sphaerochaetaceae bacterium]